MDGGFIEVDTVQAVEAGTYLRFVLGAVDDSAITETAASNVQLTLYTTEGVVRITLDNTVSTASITAAANHRYIGNPGVALTQVAFTPCNTGLCELTFTTGSTPLWADSTGAVMPAWFTGLDAGYIYEMSFQDKRGVVMEWPT